MVKALQIEIGLARESISATEAEVNIFCSVNDEIVNGVVAIKVEFRQINTTHVIDSSENELRKKLSAW